MRRKINILQLLIRRGRINVYKVVKKQLSTSQYALKLGQLDLIDLFYNIAISMLFALRI